MTINIIHTPYSDVLLSARTLKWLDTMAPGWREGAFRKARTKMQQETREQIQRLEDAVALAAEVAWVNGDKLEEF